MELSPSKLNGKFNLTVGVSSPRLRDDMLREQPEGRKIVDIGFHCGSAVNVRYPVVIIVKKSKRKK